MCRTAKVRAPLASCRRGLSISTAGDAAPLGLRPIVALAVLVGLLVGLPGIAVAQSDQATVRAFDATPRVVPAEGDIVEVDLTVDTALEDLRAALVVRDADGDVLQSTERIDLLPQDPGTLALQHDLNLEASSASTGDVSVHLEEAVTGEEGNVRAVSLDGKTAIGLQVNDHEPAGGAAETPWQQAGGDPAHTGRTLALGPDTVEVVRWSFESSDGQAFHTPRIAEDGTVYAVSWGGNVYALDAEGEPEWSSPVRLPGQTSYPPALAEDGSLLVPDGGGSLVAVTPDGAIAWRYESPDDEQLLSTPVVGPDGRIFVVREPWTLVQLSPSGDTLHETPVPEPAGETPRAPAVPELQPGPRLAVTPDGEAVTLSEEGLALVHRDGRVNQTRAFDCSCTPRAVSLSQDIPVAVTVGAERVAGVSVRTGIEVWNVTTAEAPTDGDTWHAAAIGWDEQAYLGTEDGVLMNISLEDPDQVSHRRFQAPIRGQPVVDADHQVYVADACSLLRSLTPDFQTRWITEIDADACHGLGGSLAVTPAGNLLWPGPDGELRLLGSNRAPSPDFEVRWQEGTFTLDASNSSDPDGNALSYAWRVGNETTGQGRIFQPDLERSGTHTVTLTVSDRTTSASTSREVDVNFPPEPAIQSTGTGMTVRLDAYDTGDPEGGPLTFNWTVDGAHHGTDPEITFNATEPRVFDVQLTVHDPDHTVSTQRTVVAPDHSAWTLHRVTLYEQGCSTGICTEPSSLSLVNGSLAKFHVINGADRTVDVHPAVPTVLGSPDVLQLTPGRSDTLYTHVVDTDTVLEVTEVGSRSASATVPASVRPAPAELTWRTSSIDETPYQGRSTDVELHLEGSAPPTQAPVTASLHGAGETLASTTVTLPAGETVNRTVTIPWTPGMTGEIDLGIQVESQDPDAAGVSAHEDEPGTRTVTVEESPLWATVLSKAQENRVWLATIGLVALGAGGVGAVVYRRRAEPATEGASPSTAATPVAGSQDDATVASSFMPRKVERFHVEQVLGEGGFGRTYRARDTVLEREVVLKELEHVGEGDARDLLLHEAKTAANLHHANVVVVHDVVEEEGRPLIVMEHVPGGTLGDRLGDPMSVKEALPVINDVLEGLGALHEAGIVHRDVKPSNILITPDRVAKITDFGVAATLDGAAPDEGDRFVGTPRYMAPEQLAGDPPGPQADVYGAGALLYQMLTGRHHLGLDEETPSPSSLLQRSPELPAPDVPEELNRILEVALAEDPQDRYEDARAFLDALRSFSGATTKGTSAS